MSYHELQHHAKAPGALWESAKQACKLKSKSHHPQNHQQRAGESSHSFLSYLVKYKNKLCCMTYCMWFYLQKIFQVAKGDFEGQGLKKPQLQATTNEIKPKQHTTPTENTVLPTSWYILYICTEQSLRLQQVIPFYITAV